MSLSSFRPRNRAFTLIELLVVIAIIAILAAILFPVFAQAKAAAKTATCLSNVKQISIGAYLYMQDADDSYPPVTTSSIDSAGNQVDTAWWWSLNYGVRKYDPKGGALQPYMKNYQIDLCQSATDVKPGAPVSWEPVAVTNYGINNYFNSTQYLSFSAFEEPAGTIMVGDSGALYGPGGVTSSPFESNFVYAPNSGAAFINLPNTRGVHNNRANLGWMDGHAKAMNVTLPQISINGGSPTQFATLKLGFILPAGVSDLSLAKANNYYSPTKVQ